MRMASTEPQKECLTKKGAFHTTRWSVVLDAQGRAAGDSMRSLEALCRQYWPPLYAYARYRGVAPQDAEDLTQEFFARLLEKEWLAAVKRECGRFRTFLLMAFKRFMANEWDRSQARKRGGGREVISLDLDTAESLVVRNAASMSVPAETLYEKRWALTLMETVMRRLKAEHEEGGRIAEYELLKPSLTADRGEIGYDELARALGMEPASARSAVHRLRKRFREVFREEVAGTVAAPAEVDAEMRAVIAALGSA
jgi:RNA polymerase sigma factor (sigma-70 family)